MQADRVDESAVGFDYQGKTEKHESQKGLSCSLLTTIAQTQVPADHLLFLPLPSAFVFERKLDVSVFVM